MEQVENRSREIEKVRDALGIGPEDLFRLGFPPARLDEVPMQSIVSKISSVINEWQPDEVLIPFGGDAHSDHRIANEAASSSLKWFRCPSVKRVLVYETPSETDAAIHSLGRSFRPNIFVDVASFVDKKLALLEVYSSEMGRFPFPRSREAVLALAQVRGSQAGMLCAEAFELAFYRE